VPDARLLTRADIGAASQTLAAAFADDPVWQYLAPSRARWRRHAARIFAADISNRLGHGHVYATEGMESIAVWSPPDTWEHGLIQLLREGPAAARLFSTGALRAVRYQSSLERAHPRPSHYYLAILGTAPEHQGHGFASKALAPVLRRCDEEGMPAYLESSKEQNLAFYARHRFVGDERLEVLSGAPPVWPMWREPAAS